MKIKFEDFLRSKNIKATEQEVNGLRSRLVFAGVDPDSNDVHASITEDLLDKLLEKMRYSKKEMHEYAEKTSTSPKIDAFKTNISGPSDSTVLVCLVNGRVASLNTKNNVVMPLKVQKDQK